MVIGFKGHGVTKSWRSVVEAKKKKRPGPDKFAFDQTRFFGSQLVLAAVALHYKLRVDPERELRPKFPCTVASKTVIWLSGYMHILVYVLQKKECWRSSCQQILNSINLRTGGAPRNLCFGQGRGGVRSK